GANHFQYQAPVQRYDIGVQRANFLFLFVPQRGVVVRMVEHKALDDLLRRPRREVWPRREMRLEFQRPRAGDLDRAAGPDVGAREPCQRLAAIAVVDDGPVTHRRIALLDGLEKDLRDEFLEVTDRLEWPPVLCGKLFELAAVVERQCTQRPRVVAPGGRAVQVSEFGIVLRLARRVAAQQPGVEFYTARHRGSTSVA